MWFAPTPLAILGRRSELRLASPKQGQKQQKGPILAPSPWEYDEKSSASLGRAALRLWRDVALGGPAEHIEEKMAKKKKAAAKKGGGAKAKGKAKTNPILSLGVPRFGCALVPCLPRSLFLCCSLRGSGAAGGRTGRCFAPPHGAPSAPHAGRGSGAEAYRMLKDWHLKSKT